MQNNAHQEPNWNRLKADAQVLGNIFEALFSPHAGAPGNNYELHAFIINGDAYEIERDGKVWYWSLGLLTDNELYNSCNEALQAALTYASARAERHREAYSRNADIREQASKEGV